MIDTDKYEGHTEGPWELSKYTGVGGGARLHTHVKDKRRITDKATVVHLPRRWLDEMTKADKLLMTDAPALLAEVERHRPPKVDGKYMAWSDSHPNHDRRTWIEQVMEGITDVGYWTWVNWQLQYGDDFINENGEMFE